ncbi:MAG TPA: choice-of-anchor P family protein [Nocardioides sp.]|nr:choice-of-anchor P family protein [Nocardioides sp.]
MTSAAVAIATASTLSITALGGLIGSPAAGQAPTTHEKKGNRDAGFALKATGYGTRLTGGQVPAGSDQTAFTAIGCATKVGLVHENHEAEATLPGAGTVSGVKTKIWTARKDGAVHTWSRNTTADVLLAQSGLGKIEISAIRSVSHAWHDADGFHAERSSSIGKIKFVPPAGPAQEIDIPTPGQPVDIPGLARIAVGGGSKTQNGRAGVAVTNALRIHLIPTDTNVTVAHTSARVLDGARHGAFHGSSAATQISAVDSNITSGRNPLSLMPCQGTDGKVQSKKIAHVDLGGQLVVEGLASAQRGKQLPGKSVAMERGSIAGLNLGGGQLVVDAVVGQANVTRKGNKVTSSTRGTTLGTITANGEPQSFPDTDVIEIPGLAKIERNIVTKSKFGISVVALRITLLDGTGAVIDLGVAEAKIR